MARPRKSLLNDLSTADLKRLLAARERIDTLEKERAQLVKAFTAIDKELDRLVSEATGSPARKKAVRRKKTTTAKAAAATKRKKTTTRKKTAKKAAGKPAKRSAGKKAAAEPKVKLEDVVAGVIGKKKGPVAFQDLYAAIVKGKLFRSKSRNFDNVLRRTLSTSKKIKRVGRGLYDIA